MYRIISEEHVFKENIGVVIKMAGHEILIEDKVRKFLSEDLGFGDITTDSIIDE